ncbi:hydrogenase-4 component F [Anaerobacterium chartisolvens]|uniref:Hydrogenase-4 component F n=1 Tax=Anaerobacterium chartisolvens TaxID=1297424 RepID=A0A369B8E9_9FIRM|nr:hydrogenase 4 subunit F [Anaerobacterium chartisolvens]RCX16868.1 hydrogenase-4 component F [Anaerobacterium chartisolvens]
MYILLLMIIPLISCGLFWTTNKKNVINTINACGAASLLVVSIIVIWDVLRNEFVSPAFFNNIFYIDALSALILFVTVSVVFLASVFSIGYMNEELKRGVINIRRLKLYYSLLHVFVFTMILTVSTQNMGLMWIAVEATTLASAFLVGFYSNKKSIEAAWKYIIICSVGIAFAMLGTVMLYYSSVHSLGESAQGLNWQYLFQSSDRLQGSILRISFIFILVGFGTKVGLAPMHTWLPDAHSQAPSPISALLSGVLLNTAMYSIIRVMAIVNRNAGSNMFTGRLLMALGIISIGTAAVFILVQKDFKRILAYSSIEHMGIIALGLGMLSPLSVFGALYHVLNHAFTKSMLFLASGSIYLKYETKIINKVQGIFKIMPVTGTAFMLGLFAITGMPPFGIFSSELNIIMASFNGKKYIIAGLLLLFLALIFAGFAAQMFRMFYGRPLSKETHQGEINWPGTAVLVILLLIITVTGLYLPYPVNELINRARDIILLPAGG